MSKHIHIHAFVVAAFLAAMFVPTALPAAAASCESLAGLKLPDTTITMAQSLQGEYVLVEHSFQLRTR